MLAINDLNNREVRRRWKEMAMLAAVTSWLACMVIVQGPELQTIYAEVLESFEYILLAILSPSGLKI